MNEDQARAIEARLIKLAARLARRELLPDLDHCRTIQDARSRVALFDEAHGYVATEAKQIADALTTAIIAVRREAIEEAAKWHEARASDCEKPRPFTDTNGALRHLRYADAIRALSRWASVPEESSG